MASAFSWQNFVSLCSASFCTPRPNLPVIPGVSWLPTFAFQSPIMKRTFFLINYTPMQNKKCKKMIIDVKALWYLLNLEKEMATHSSILAWKIPWTEKPGGLLSTGSHRVRHDWSNLACMHALEKEMATQSSVLAWRIPGMEEPGGLLSMGSHRVRHDWSDLAAAAANSVEA